MENNLEKYLLYCSTWSLYARWQRYMSDYDNKRYNYFIDIWDNALITAEDIANDKDLLSQLERMLSFLPSNPNDNINSYYNICIMHTIWVITGDKRLEKWILYWTEVANEEVKRINRGEDSVSEIFCDFMSTIKKYKRVLIDINKGLVDIFNDLSIMSWRYDKSKVMNDEERADFINKLIDILSDVDINDVEEYETTITETKAITKAITDETETDETKTDGTKTITKTQTDETIKDETITQTKTKTGTDEMITETGTAENNKTLLEELTPIFYGNKEQAEDYIKKIKNITKDVEKIRYTAQLVNENTISEMSCHRDLYSILHDHRLYNKSESNWNKVISQYLVKK